MFKKIPFKRSRAVITTTQHGLLYEITLGLLAVLGILLLAYELLGNPSPIQLSIILAVDVTIAWIFLTDFLVGVTVSTDRRAYAKQNWLNLVSSIPIHTEVVQAMRILRVVRTLRIIRGLAAISNFQRAKRIVTRTLHKKS